MVDLWPSQISYHSSSSIASFVNGSTITDFIIDPPTVSITLITNSGNISVFKIHHFSCYFSLLRCVALQLRPHFVILFKEGRSKSKLCFTLPSNSTIYREYTDHHPAPYYSLVGLYPLVHQLITTFQLSATNCSFPFP